jgi:hypothetical protein
MADNIDTDLPTDGSPQLDEKEAMLQASASGPTRFGGIIQEEFLQELRWPDAYKVYDEMRKNSAAIGGFIRAIESAFRAVRWYAIPFDDTQDDKIAAAFLEQNLHDMSRCWSDVMTDMLTMVPFGFAPTEMVFKWRRGRGEAPPSKFSDGRIGFKDFILIPQNTIMEWVYDEPDNPSDLLGLKQMDLLSQVGGGGIIEIPIKKILNFRVRAERDNPEGESVLRQAYRSYYFQTNLEVVEAISLERTGAGIPVMKLPKESTTKAKLGNASDEQKAQNIVKALRADEQGGVVIPETWELELLTAQGLRPELFDLAIKRHRPNLLISVLAAFLEMGTARVGSFATSKVGRSFFEAAFDGWTSAVEDPINDKAVPLLFELNGWDTDRLPKLTHSALAGEDIEEIMKAITDLGKEGFLEKDDPALRQHLKSLLRIPEGSTVVEREAQPDSYNEEEEPMADPMLGEPDSIDDPTLDPQLTSDPTRGVQPDPAMPNSNGTGAI